MGTKVTTTRKQQQSASQDTRERYVRWFEELRSEDVPLVGGKNASLGEMIHGLKEKNIRVPEGFATTASAYWEFLEANTLTSKIKAHLEAYRKRQESLEKTGKAIRRLFMHGHFPQQIAEDIRNAYRELCRRYNQEDVDVAARSSATAEDLPEASFAGQHETFLNVSGEHEVLEACQRCFASLFTDRAISYREKNGFDHMKVSLSVGVQKMVRSDKAGAGVIFSIDTETGFPKTVLINAAWGLGETVVQGIVTPDEYMVFKALLRKEGVRPIIEKTLGGKEKKIIYATGGTRTTQLVDTPSEERRAFVLSDNEILQLARWAVDIEEHYHKPMDMEWAKDGDTGDIYIVQARPETVQSQKVLGTMKTYTLMEKGPVLITGLSIGEAITSGRVSIICSPEEMDRFEEGDILVTEMTEPDWVPIIRKAAGIVTNTGGRTSHAAIVSREYGIPAIVGTRNATQMLSNGQEITISCAEGAEGYVYEGVLAYDTQELRIEDIPDTETQVMINIASPAAAYRWWRLPAHGIGLARMEFIIGNLIKIHPLALLHFDRVEDPKEREQIERLTRGYDDKAEYFVDKLAKGIAKIASSQYPMPVLMRTSDFKTNEYASLIGGKGFEPHEHNPMLGFRGASRYYSDAYRDGFALECRAIRQAREEIGLDNIHVMIPFCRTLEEADRVIETLCQNGLERGKAGLELYVMAEIPSNIVLATEFAQRFDGFSIGSNDLTQLVLGVDRDNGLLNHLFDENNEAVRRMILFLIEHAHKAGTKVGICGQGPSDNPELAAFLVQAGIDSISLNPDTMLQVKQRIAAAEKNRHRYS